MRGLPLLILCAIMFDLVTYAAHLEKRSSQRLGLLNTYKSIFSLNDEDLYDMKTPDEFWGYLGDLSRQSRLLQPLSSLYFIQETGEKKVMQGVRKFSEEKTVELEGLGTLHVHTCYVIIIPSSRCKHFVILRPVEILLHKRTNPRVHSCNDLDNVFFKIYEVITS